MTEQIAARCVVLDAPAEPIRVALFTEGGAGTVVTVDATRAITIASDLLIASRRRLAVAESDMPITAGLQIAERDRLPNRRFQATRKLTLEGMTFHLSIGCDAERRPREVFIKGGKEGSDAQLLVEHVAIIISLALQRGASPADLLKTLARAGEPDAKWPAQLIPAVLDALVEEGAQG